MIDLAPHHLEKIRSILGKHVPQCEVRAFGSRVDWTAKDYSDLDLAVVASAKLSNDTLRHLKEAFEESDLPFRVEVLDWHAISPDFQKVIEKEYEVIQGPKSDDAAGDSLPAGWRLVKLGDLGEVNRGRSRHRPRYAEHLYGGPYPFVQTGDIKNSAGRVTNYQQTYSEAGWPKVASGQLARFA